MPGMSESVYIESSVVSYLTARPSRDLVIAGRQAITADWWLVQRKRYDVYISELVIEEISAGHADAAAARLAAVSNFASVSTTPEAHQLAEALLASGAVPANSPRDALHIAIAATQGVEFLLTWNFKHINNAETRSLIAKVVADHGCVCPVLCSPEELGASNDSQ